MENNTKFFEDNYDWKTYNVEPFNHVFSKLVINRPNSININKALSNENGFKKMRVYDIHGLGIFNGNGSIEHTDSHKKLLESVSDSFIEQEVETITYKDLIKDLGISKIDLFVLDVEGYETRVIDGMVDCDILPDVFVIEHGHVNPGYFDRYLDKLSCKYKLDFISHVNSFYIKT